MSSHYLVYLLFLPLLTAVVVAFCGPNRGPAIRWLSLGSTLLSLLLAVLVTAQFLAESRPTPAEGPPRFEPTQVENVVLVHLQGSSGLRFYVGVDGLNVWLVLLTALLMVTAVLVSWTAITVRVNEFYAWLLVLQFAMEGVFLAFDIILFYVFFELTLVPLFFLIGIWGGDKRVYAARKFFIYTLAGSMITLLGVLGIVVSLASRPQHDDEPTKEELTFEVPKLVRQVGRESRELVKEVRAQEQMIANAKQEVQAREQAIAQGKQDVRMAITNRATLAAYSCAFVPQALGRQAIAAGPVLYPMGVVETVLVAMQGDGLKDEDLKSKQSAVVQKEAGHTNKSDDVKREEEKLKAPLAALAQWRAVQFWVFLAMAVGFAIKVPLVPVHTWLPLAHVEAPTAGSVLLAGVLLKIGAYGFLRLCVPLAPDAALTFGAPLIAGLAVIGILYGSFCALAQKDIKKLVAYSSVSHLGYCMLGLFALNEVGLGGSMLQMINHGLSTGALFLLVGMLYERYHTREMDKYGGMAARLHLLAVFFVFITMTSIGLPGLNGFVGELLTMMGMYMTQTPWLYGPTLSVLAACGVVLGAWYMLTLLRRVFFGPVKEPHHHGDKVKDLNGRELAALVPIAVCCIVLGVWPKPFLDSTAADMKVVARIAAEARERADVSTSLAGQHRDDPTVLTARSERP